MAFLTQPPMVSQLNINIIGDLLLANLEEDGLRDQFFSQLLSKEKDGGRTKHVYQHLLRYQLMPKKPYASKCDQLSTELKNEGNKLFDSKNFSQALNIYSAAVKFAASSEMISVAFSNRSAALYHLGKYRECLLDIERAIDAGYSERLMPKLLDRKKRCEEAIELTRVAEVAVEIEKENMRKEIFQFPEKRMAGVPCASASLEISYSDSMGRGIMATEDIRPGQVLVVEEPYLSVLKKENYNFRCYFCCLRNIAMIACETCTYVMYCNEGCRTKSWDLGHRFECGIMSHLVNMNFREVDLESIRILLQVRCQHSSWDSMLKTIDSIEKETDPKLKGFTIDSDNVLKYGVKKYAAIHMLETNMEKWDKHYIYLACLASAVLLYMLKECTPFFADHPNISKDICIIEDEFLWRAGDLLFRYGLLTMINDFVISKCVKKFPNSNIEYNDVARGIYALSSLFNHSCAPNSYFIFRGTTIKMLSQRFIKKGEQVCITYKPEYHTRDLLSRQLYLDNVYRFKCKCEACINNWPLNFNLRKANFVSKKNKRQFRQILNENSLQNLLKSDKKYDFNFIKQVYKNIMLLEECAPCAELVLYQNFIKEFWALLGNLEHF